MCALLAGKVAAYERLRGMYLEEIQSLTVRITEKAQLLTEQPDLVRRPLLLCANSLLGSELAVC